MVEFLLAADPQPSRARGLAGVQRGDRAAVTPQAGNGPPLGEIEALIQLGQIGHVSGINAKLAEIEANSPEHGAFVKDLRVIVDSFKLGEFLTVLEAQRSHHAP